MLQSVFSKKLWRNVAIVDCSSISFQIVYNVSVTHEGRSLGYSDLCAKWRDYCYDNEILRLSELIPSIEAKEINITYPIYFDPYTFEVRSVSTTTSQTSNFSFLPTFTAVAIIFLLIYLFCYRQ